MGGILLVPIHLDALWLEKDLSVIEPRVDFSRLPFWDGTRDVNPDVANLGEEIVTHPFQDKGFQLRAGIHLHWALPDGLTRGSGKTTDKQKKHTITFPAVPNRWLVSRSRGDAETPEQQWIVESDHLHPETTDKLHHAISIPFPAAAGHPPFRYLGRRKPFAGWKEDSRPHCLAQAGYQLTAVGYERRPDAGSGQSGGYGEATFAAFYPNCHSVFGFHDPAPAAARQSVRYEVIGWYSDTKMDPLWTRQFLDAMAAASKALPKEATEPDWRCAALAEVFRWEATVCWVQPASTAARRDMPDRTVCYARLEVDAGDPPTPFLPDTSVSVAVGNTSTEALSAYLAGGNVKLEDQLEALHLERRLDGKTLDIGFKFMEARHEKGFSPVAGGTLWTIRPATSTGAPDTDPGDEELPDGLRPVARLLNQLNLRQAEYDGAAEALVSMRRQLFADWHKYMLSAYPPDDRRDEHADVDEARHFIENYGLLPVKAQKVRVDALQNQGNKAVTALRAELDRLGKKDTNKPYVLQPIPAPRYWQPHEPAILIVDECVEPSRRHGQDGRLSAEGLLGCQIMPATEEPIERHIAAIRKAISAARPGADQTRIGFDRWSGQPWNPFALEWCVEVFPLRQESNVKSADGTYWPAFVTTNYELAKGAIDLKIRPGQAAIQPATSAYSGSSLITPHAKRQLESTIKAYLKKQDSLEASERDPGSKAIGAAYATLTSEGFHAMAQKLGGFNDALLMHRHILQLPIAEPLGLDESRRFTGRVRDAVDNQNRSAPQPRDGFHPIRSGALRIRALRLVDTFGRTRSLTVRDEKVFVAEALATRGAPHLISLPPRIAQPARLNVRWLAAENAKADEMEMNAHPATSPICGWLLLNDLDESLMAYDSDGTPLGSIDSECAWVSVPGTRAGDEPKIDNRYLNTLLLHLKGLGATQFKLFLAGLQRELEQIDPEGHAQQEALALLIGRPMAVVRATIDLQIRGLPAINQSWASFTADLDRYLDSESTPGASAASRDTDAFTRIQFPIRLGDSRQLNDGVIGFWKESWSRNGKFCVYEQHGDLLGRHPAGDADLLLSIDSAPQKLTMLIDPRAAVHASSGILPMKSIRIPSDQYADALKRIAVTFLCAPVLTPGSKISIPVPGIAAAAWKWRTGDEKATDVSALTTEVDLDAKQEIREGWLQLKLEE